LSLLFKNRRRKKKKNEEKQKKNEEGSVYFSVRDRKCDTLSLEDPLTQSDCLAALKERDCYDDI